MKICGLHHIAYKCADPEQTRAFYEDILGLPLKLTLEASVVPTTGGPQVTYFHFFFEMLDGSSVAFFDLADNEMPLPSPNVPPWANHLALQVESLEELKEAHRKLTAAGVDVVGELDHEFVRSIYFFDPNGIRLELTAAAGDGSYEERGKQKAKAEFGAWLQRRHQITAQLKGNKAT